MSRFDLSNSRKFCMVCGDKALGYNFNAVTCESCKAFFRRNALLSKKFTCPFNENCDITVVTRRFCQRCRLKKCFRVGMKKEHIMSEEDKLKKKVKIQQNRVKRSMTLTSTTDKFNEKLATENWSKLEPFGENQENIDLVTTPLCSTQTTTEIVDCLIQCSENALQTISQLANTKEEIIDLLVKICDSPSDALKLIKYLLDNPSGAINIVRKIANKHFDTFTFLMKLMSAPNETKEIMFKISTTPDALLNFLGKILRSPEQIDDLIYAFHTAPCEALSKINSMIKVNDITEHKNIYSNDCSMISSMLDNCQGPNENLSNGNTSSSISTNCAFSRKHSANSVGQLSSPNPKLPEHDAKNILEDVGDKLIQPNSIESVLCEAIKLEYETFRSLPQLIGDRDLNEAERARLNELKLASKALYYPVDDDLSSLINDDERMKYEGGQQDPQLLKVINLTAVAIRRLIKMSKKISAFRNMCQEDQVALLKGGCTEMMIMRSVMTYDCDHATWKIPHSKEDMSNIKVDVLKLAKGNVYEEHERFIQTFEPKWRMDENIILIMCAILLFTPSRPRVIHSDVIKLEQNSYYYLLRRYLESVYPGCEAKLTFIKLIQKISEVERLNNVIIGVYLNVNPSKVEPLLREIFDLKNH